MVVVCLSHRALVFVLLVLHTASGIPQQSNRYVERASFGDWPAITSYRGAILVKNGRQTSCEFALIDQKSAFIAASCLDLNSGTMTVNDNTRHEIFFDNGKGANVTSSRILTANVHIHPDFDPASYANNIAIVVYTIDQKRTWTNAISVNRDEWTNALFVRRYMESEKSKSWRSPMINSGAWGGLPGCDTASGIYAANQRDFLCSTESSSVTTVGACKYPYSSVYGVVSPKMAIAALHSHTVVQGDAMCGAKQTFHYYTVLAGYVGFAQKVLGYDIKYFTISGDFSSSIDASYKMQPPAFGIPKGLRLFGGDVFIPGPGVAGTDEAPLPVPSPPPSPDAPSAAPDAPAPDAPAPNVPKPNNPPATATNTPAHRSAAANVGVGNNRQEVPTDDSGPVVGGEGEPNGNDANLVAMPSAASRTLSSGSVVPGGSNGNAGMLTGTHGQGGALLGNNNRESYSNSDDGTAANNATSNDNDHGGLASGQIVAICIFVPMAFIGLLVGAFYLRRWYRLRRLERNWDASKVRQIVDTHMTENELGLSPSPANFQLPSYRDYGGTMLIATSPGSSPR